jgi:hypothetical protein
MRETTALFELIFESVAITSVPLDPEVLLPILSRHFRYSDFSLVPKIGLQGAVHDSRAVIAILNIVSPFLGFLSCATRLSVEKQLSEDVQPIVSELSSDSFVVLDLFLSCTTKETTHGMLSSMLQLFVSKIEAGLVFLSSTQLTIRHRRFQSSPRRSRMFCDRQPLNTNLRAFLYGSFWNVLIPHIFMMIWPLFSRLFFRVRNLISHLSSFVSFLGRGCFLRTDLDHSFLRIVISKFRCPDFLADIFTVCFADFSNFGRDFFLSVDFVQMMAKVGVLFPTFSPALQSAIFKVVIALLGHEVIQGTYLSSNIFLPVFVAFAYETTQRPMVLDLYRRALNDNARLSELSIPAIFDVVWICKECQTIDEVDFCFELLRMANELPVRHPSLDIADLNCQQVLTALALHMRPIGRTKEILEEMMLFFRLVGHEIDRETAAPLSLAFKRLLNRPTNESFFGSLEFLLTRGTRPIPNYSFASVLVWLCSMDVLLPLFAHLDMASQRLCPMLARLFRFCLIFHTDVQRRFWETRGFSTVSFLLMASSPAHLTFETYIEFFESFHDLKAELFDQILMNFGVWAKAPPSEVPQVAEHWLSILSGAFHPHSLTLRGFPAVLFAIAELFGYSSGIPNVVHIRRHLFEIAHAIMSESGVTTFRIPVNCRSLPSGY